MIQQSLVDNDRSLAYDWVGNILNINDGLNQHGYGYDPMNRLLSASTTDYNLSYTYDRNGNRLTAGSATELNNYSYDPASNKLAAVQGAVVKNYQYDETGDTLSDGLHAYLYDAKNQLTDVTGVTSYFYNGLGQRTAKNSNGTLTRYAYDENARLIGEYNATGQAIQETVYLFGQPVAVLKGTAVYNVHADHLGSPRKITSQAGNTVWQWQDKPFGDAPVNPDPDGNGVAFEYNLRFPGQSFDKETGLHYNYHRYYDPQTGRYITSDPIGLEGGLNTYGYVGGNPVNFVDPTGKNTLVVGSIVLASSALMAAATMSPANQKAVINTINNFIKNAANDDNYEQCPPDELDGDCFEWKMRLLVLAEQIQMLESITGKTNDRRAEYVASARAYNLYAEIKLEKYLKLY